MSGLTTLILSLLGFAGDEISKELARKKLAGKDKELFGGKVKLMLRENKGFAMNKLQCFIDWQLPISECKGSIKNEE